MAFKLSKKEFVHRRPKWLTRFLFNIPPATYMVYNGFSSAKEGILSIKKIIEDLHILDKRSRLHLFVSDDALEIKGKQNRTIVRFQIEPIC